jgi:hypothetical protein
MLIKLSPGVNFINILRLPILYKSAFCSFSPNTVWLSIFWHKHIGEKAACKMLMTLTTGLWRHQCFVCKTNKKITDP